MERCKPVMGHREKLISGDEYDVLTQWRRVHAYKAGTVKAIKRKFNKRTRRQAKESLQESI